MMDKRIIAIMGATGAQGGGLARAIAAEAGLDTGQVLTGEDLAPLGDAVLAQRVGAVGVFARIMPEQKGFPRFIDRLYFVIYQKKRKLRHS